MHDEDVPEALTAGLYVVATPIGNLADMTARAVSVLRSAQLIAAEDTRHSQRLLTQYGIKTRCLAYHEHSEEKTAEKVISALREGHAVALISDAGTPLISDPGYRLVNQVVDAGFTVVPVPGPSAVIAALSVAGLPTDSFTFGGFLPAKTTPRKAKLAQLVETGHTLVFYEAPHRLEQSLEDMAEVFGEQRQAVVARELTKVYETLIRGSLRELIERVAVDRDQSRGEIVLLVAGASKKSISSAAVDGEQVLKTLMAELPLKQAASLAAKITGAKKNELYKRALDMKDDQKQGL